MKVVQEIFTAQARPGEAWGGAGLARCSRSPPRSSTGSCWEQLQPGRAGSSLPHYPYTDKHFAWIRTKLQAVPWCEESASTATCCSGPSLHTRGTHGGAAEPAEAPREHAAQSGSSLYRNPGFQRQTNHLQLYSEGDTALGPVFTTGVSSYGPRSRIAPRITETRLDLQRISRSTIVDQQQTFIALYMWCCSRHCGTG